MDRTKEIKTEVKRNKKNWTKDMKHSDLVRTDTVESWNFSTTVKGKPKFMVDQGYPYSEIREEEQHLFDIQKAEISHFK